MNTKKIIMGLGVVASLGGISQIPVNPEPLSVNEWQGTVALYDYEVKQSGGKLDILNYKDFQDINDEIRKRVPTENVTINDTVFTPTEYSALRENVLKKVEEKTLLENLIN